MRRQLNFTIRSRLLLGFGLAALLTLAVAIVAIISLRGLGQNLSSMAVRDRLLQTGAIELRLSIEQEGSAVRGYLLTGDIDFLSDFTTARVGYDNKLAQLRRLGPSREVADLLSEVDSTHSTYTAIANEQSMLRDMGFSKAAVFLWQTEGNDIKSNLDGKLVALIARQEGLISSHTSDAQRQQTRTLVISIALVLLTWGAAISGWHWIGRSITTPITDLLEATQQIGMGKLDTRVEVSGNDEFSALGLAMNQMVAELSDSRRTEEDLLKQEQRRSDQMRTINEVSRQTSSILSLEELLPAVVNQLQQTFNYYNVNIFLVDSGANSVVLKACQGADAGKALLGTRSAFNESIVGWVASAGERFLANDVSREPRYRFVPEFASTRAELAVPIKYATAVLGVLDIRSAQVNAFDEIDTFAVQTLADQVAVAVHNAQLYEKARELAALEERQRLARDLHDAVSQTLFSASLIAEVLPRLWERDSSEGRKRLQEVRELTRGALAEMRTLLFELRPTALADADIRDLLHQLAESITGRARVAVSAEFEGQCSLSADTKIGLYRIAQEALNNVAKHSGASKAVVTLRCQVGKAELCIKDNGRGFDLSNVQGKSLGLGIMRERAKGIGACLALKSEIDEGTEVTAVWKASNAECEK